MYKNIALIHNLLLHSSALMSSLNYYRNFRNFDIAMPSQQNIRNFCIIAHIDHGKSTLADRLLENTHTVAERDQKEQVLDDMDLERERGITIKSHAIQMKYTSEFLDTEEEFTLNLIDTPGHVDFSYEVSRAITSCEGAILLVDASQGIQAQTLSNLYLALEHDLEIIPVLNKIDLDEARPDELTEEMVDLIGCDPKDVLRTSAKTGEGVIHLLDTIIEEVPPPEGNPDAPLQGLIFDSMYDNYRGVVAYFRVFDGSIKAGEKVKFMQTGQTYDATEVGTLRLQMKPEEEIPTGSVGYIVTGIKDSSKVKVGDTITHAEKPSESAIKGFEEVKPMVFAGLYPVDQDDFEELREALEKLRLNDASLSYQPESSAALGYGFRCGFLGMLHMEIIQERLNREYDVGVITTIPNVSYIVHLQGGDTKEINNPEEYPNPAHIDYIEEPYIEAQIITNEEYIGNIMNMCINDKRGELQNQVYLTPTRVELTFEMPLAEIVFDFYDKLKSLSRGFASLDYRPIGYRKSELVKLDILLNEEPVDALSLLIHEDKAYRMGRKLCKKLKDLVPQHQFMIPIQAAIGSNVIARENIKALRKDVTAKCYGGDVTRKRKLLERQKEGKKKMRQVGKVDVPQKAFMEVLKLGED
jgi:GTP-binding protein LepA